MVTSARRTVGRVCWLLQPPSVVAEVVTASFVTAPYSYLHNTISDLGARSCTTVRYPGVDVAVCSPAHALLNASFAVGGVLLVVGALALRPTYARGKAGNAACVLWVISGLGSVAVGLVPLDVDLALHTVVSIPAILLQPVALLLHATVLARTRRRWWVLVVVAIGVLAVGAFFVVRLDPRWGGLLERAAIWPVLLALPLLALAPALGRGGRS